MSECRGGIYVPVDPDIPRPEHVECVMAVDERPPTTERSTTYNTCVALDGSSYYLRYPYKIRKPRADSLREYYDDPEVAIAVGSFYFGIESGYIFPYCGLTDLIYLLFSALQFSLVHIPKHEFPVYRFVLNRLVRPYGELENDLRAPYARAAGWSLAPGSIFVISRPNSILGVSMDIDAIKGLLRKNPKVLFIIDEAYQVFSSDISVLQLIQEYPNLVCLKTASKEFSLPGARLAWLITRNEEVLTVLHNRTYNTVSHMAELLIEDIVQKQRKTHTRNILHIVNERMRIEETVNSDSVHMYRGSQTCMVLVSTPGELYEELKTRCLGKNLHPLFLKDFEVYDQFVLQAPDECFVRFNVWSAEVNDSVINILNTL